MLPVSGERLLSPGGRSLADLEAEELTGQIALMEAQARELQGLPPLAYADPGELARALDPTYRLPAHIALIHERFVAAVRARGGRLIVLCAPQEGKEIGDDVPVWTTRGWVRHGDLQVGDGVFHPSGRPTRVVAVHPPSRNDDRVVVTSTGARIICHAKHEWKVWDRDQTGPDRWRTMETAYLAAYLRADPARQFHLPPVAHPVLRGPVGWLGLGLSRSSVAPQ